MVDEKVKRVLNELNPFWRGPFKLEYKERSIYSEIRKMVKEPQIISLCGLRRVGKTTILRKIMSDLLEGNPPDSILYFSFDDFQALELLDVIDGFREIHGKDPKFLFFDEIQKLPNWAEKVKLLYDTGKYKIFISGSESLFLRKGSRESLAGRLYEFEVKRLSFSEYLNFVGKAEMAEKPQLYDVGLKKEFEMYALTAGFPEMIGKEDRATVKQYIRNAVVEKIVFMDMARIYPIENPAQLISILDMLTDNPGMIVDFASLSQELGIHRHTLAKYFEYLEMAHLVVKLYNFSRNRVISEKRLKKFYPAFLSSALADGGEEWMGKVVETLCVVGTGAKFFWRDKYKDEVDIVLQKGDKIVPVEIKYQNKPGQNRGLGKFCKKYGCKEAILVTKNARKSGGEPANVAWMPAYEFLLGFSEGKPGNGEIKRKG